MIFRFYTIIIAISIITVPPSPLPHFPPLLVTELYYFRWVSCLAIQFKADFPSSNIFRCVSHYKYMVLLLFRDWVSAWNAFDWNTGWLVGWTIQWLIALFPVVHYVLSRVIIIIKYTNSTNQNNILCALANLRELCNGHNATTANYKVLNYFSAPDQRANCTRRLFDQLL